MTIIELRKLASTRYKNYSLAVYRHPDGGDPWVGFVTDYGAGHGVEVLGGSRRLVLDVLAAALRAMPKWGKR